MMRPPTTLNTIISTVWSPLSVPLGALDVGVAVGDLVGVPGVAVGDVGSVQAPQVFAQTS